MRLAPWKPFRELEAFRREMDRLFDDFFGKDWPLLRPVRELAWTGSFAPAIDMYDKAEAD